MGFPIPPSSTLNYYFQKEKTSIYLFSWSPFHSAFLLLVLMAIYPMDSAAAEMNGGAQPNLSLFWILPFTGLLASLVLGPLISAEGWYRNYRRISFLWMASFLVPFAFYYGISEACHEFLKAILHHYLPFIILIGSLYVISGGIHIETNIKGTPLNNTVFLFLATLLAGWIGTTGAAMLFIRPLIHMNQTRSHKHHTIIFFIFLVANIGGAFTPLGDPPLFLGFLNGIDFFWPLLNLSIPTIIVSLYLLVLFWAIDSYFFTQVDKTTHFHKNPWNFRIRGAFNFLLMGGLIFLVLLSSMDIVSYHLNILGYLFKFGDVLRDLGLLGLSFVSWRFTRPEIRRAHHFEWEPLTEVANLFFAIFITIIPVIYILHAGETGPLASIITAVNREGEPINSLYFWLTGLFSSVLDNAPTYLVFYYLAGGDNTQLMTAYAQTLKAISLGAVFMGALTYIGNAPNFMVRAIAEAHKIPMPNFFGYLVWACGILLPIFLLISLWMF